MGPMNSGPRRPGPGLGPQAGAPIFESAQMVPQQQQQQQQQHQQQSPFPVFNPGTPYYSPYYYPPEGLHILYHSRQEYVSVLAVVLYDYVHFLALVLLRHAVATPVLLQFIFFLRVICLFSW